MGKPIPEECCVCGCDFTIPEELYKAARHSAEICFYCPYGHGQHYADVKKEQKQQPRDDNVVPFDGSLK